MKRVLNFYKSHKETCNGWMLAFLLAAFFTPTGVLAATGTGAEATVKQILEKFISIVVLIFQAIGVILGVYSVGQLLMALKNEDPDSKIRSGTQLVIAVILIGIRPIITWLNLTSFIGS